MNMEEFEAVLLAKRHDQLLALAWAEGWSKGRAEGEAKGTLQALRETVLQLGRQRFGKAASGKQKTQLNAATDVDHLRRIRDRILTATSWQELLATP
jgi:hypothetical protein